MFNSISRNIKIKRNYLHSINTRGNFLQTFNKLKFGLFSESIGSSFEEIKIKNFDAVLEALKASQMKDQHKLNDLDKLVYEKFCKDASENKEMNDEINTPKNTKPSQSNYEKFKDYLDNLIKEEIKSEMIHFYSNSGDISNKNLLFKKIFEDVEKIRLNKTENQTEEFDTNNLTEEEKKLYALINQKVKKEENDESPSSPRNDQYLDGLFVRNTYETFYKESNTLKPFTTEVINKLNPSPYSESKKTFLHFDNFQEKKDLKFESHELNRIETVQNVKVPELSMNLINVVQNPGIYPLQSVKKMNKETSLHLIENLPTPEMILFENLDTYMRPHQDPTLKMMMKKHNYKYSSSTSGIGEALSHFFFKLTNFKSPHFYNLSEHYITEPSKFMMFQRKPACIVLNKVDKNSYAISKNNIFESKFEFILLKMGKYMEKIFTHSPEEFEAKYMRKGGLTPEDVQIVLKEEDYFKYVGYDNILLRSQIDCGGKDKEGNDIVFEIKTRAVAPIRYDVLNYTDYLDYEVDSLYGRHSSYEREFYDLIRGAFLKYLFQLKIGGMKGAFVSYHNTQKIFGFEYVSLLDMERRILGNSNFSDTIFKASLKLIEEFLDHVLKDFPDQNKLLIGVYANEWKGTLDIFVELANEDSYKDYDENKYKEIIDYYYVTGYRPQVHKYTLIVTPILNNVVTTFSPILFENSDSYQVKYQIIYSGQPELGEYMQFLHEAYMKKENLNLLNEYTGSWTGAYES